MSECTRIIARDNFGVRHDTTMITFMDLWLIMDSIKPTLTPMDLR